MSKSRRPKLIKGSELRPIWRMPKERAMRWKKEGKSDAKKAKANKALRDMQARLAVFMKKGVEKTAEKTLSREANTKWGELTETHEQAASPYSHSHLQGLC